MVVEVVLLLLLVWLLYRLLLQHSPLHHIPGPSQIPIFGNALQIGPNTLHLNMLDWYKQHGPIARFKLLRDEFVLVSDADDIYDIMVTRGTEFGGRWNTYRTQLLSEGHKDIFVTDYSEEVKWRRKIMHTFIKQFGSGMDKIEKITDELATQLVHNLCEVAQQHPVEMNYTFYSIAMDILSVMLLGISPLVNDGFQHSVSGIILDVFPWTRYLGNPAYKYFRDVGQMRKRLVASLIKIQKQNDGSEGFIKQMLETFEEEKNHDTSREVLEQLVFNFIFAGTTTTTATLTVLANTLVHHPEVQSKLQEEVYRVVGDRSVTFKDRAEMPFHMATLYELSRLLSLAYLNPHKTVKDTDLRGYKLPKGTLVIPNLFAMHHDERLWEDPWLFQPQRFLNDEGNLVPADHPNRRHLMPFGAGTRVCVGEILAQSRMFLILAKMMQTFTLLPATTMQEQPPFEVRQLTGSALLKAPLVKVRVQPIPTKQLQI